MTSRVSVLGVEQLLCCLSCFRVTGVWCAAPPGVKTTPPATCSPAASTGRPLAGTSTSPPCCRRNDLHLVLLSPHSDETPPKVCCGSIKRSHPAGLKGGCKKFSLMLLFVTCRNRSLSTKDKPTDLYQPSFESAGGRCLTL